MLRNLEGSQKQRLLGKFIESDHAKIDRLMELHFKYYNRVQKIDNRLEQEKLVDILYTARVFLQFLSPTQYLFRN